MCHAIVFQGLEPFDSWSDMYFLIQMLRKETNDDIVIYTGYYPDEITTYLLYLVAYDNIIIKFGRFIPDEKSHKDKLLGVELVSPNQFAVKLSKEYLKEIK